MISLLQRVLRAEVQVAGETIGAIGTGLLVLVCAEPQDTEATADRLVERWLKLRVFGDAAGKMNLSVADVAGGLLIVSQFTLAADLSSGNRPGFGAAANPVLGRRLYERVLLHARALHPVVACGSFGADMQVSLVNDGPVTIPMRSRG